MGELISTDKSEISKVIDGGFCVGCGNCSYLDPNNFSVSKAKNGKYSATIKNSEISDVDKICPFTDKAENEDNLAQIHLSDARKKSGFIGRYNSIFSGYVKVNDFREKATSGGMISWVVHTLFELELIDGVIHVSSTSQNPGNYIYQVDNKKTFLNSRRKSKYTSVSPATAAETIKKLDGRFAIVGLPCFIKASRLLQNNDRLYAEKVKYHIGMVCGHLKSSYYGEYLASNLGKDHKRPFEIDFRHKYKNGNSSQYGVRVAQDGKDIKKVSSSILGTGWQLNTFRYEACNFCDDVFSELADISIGDAWIEPFLSDPKGTSLIVSRSEFFDRMLEENFKKGELHLEEMKEKNAIRAQLGGLRDRREGLAYRLNQKIRLGQWVPIKRIAPRFLLSKNRRAIYEARQESQEASFRIWDDLEVCNSKAKKFDKKFEPYLQKLKALSRLSRFLVFFQKIIFILDPRNRC